MSEQDTDDVKIVVMRCPAFMATALQQAAKAEMASVNWICRRAVLKDLRQRGLIAA